MRGLLLLAVLTGVRAGARETQPVVLATSFENENWFPLTKKEMEKSAVDPALQELTRAGLIELVGQDDGTAGRLEIVVSLVERAETGKVTVTFTAHKVPTQVTTASAALHDKTHEGIYRAMVQVGREAGRKMKQRLLIAIPPDKADLALDQLLGKDWDNMTTAQLYGKAQELKRSKQYDESRTVFQRVSGHRDRGSQQWKRLADDELAFGLPMFEAGQELMGAAEHRRKADLDRIEKLCRFVLEKNKGNEARVAEAQRGLDTIQQLRTALGMVDRSEIQSRVRRLQVAMVARYAETAQAPTIEELKTMDPGLFEQAEIKNFKIDPASGDYSFDIALKSTGASAQVKGNLMRVGNEGVVFKE